MPNLDPLQFPTLGGGSDPPPLPITRVRQYNIASNTYSKPPRTNEELLLRTTAPHAIAINTLSHSFTDISSRDRNAHRFEQTFRKFASDAAKFYIPHGVISLDFHQKAGWVEIGFKNRTLRDQALEIPLIHEGQIFQPIRTYSKWEAVIKIIFEALPMDDEIGIGKALEDRLRTFLEEYGEVVKVTILQDDPENPGIFLHKAVAILIPNENILPKKGEEHLGLVAIPRNLVLLDKYTVEVNPDRCPRRCTRCREIGHAPNQCPKYGKQPPKSHQPFTPTNQPNPPIGMKRHRGPMDKWIIPAPPNSSTNLPTMNPPRSPPAKTEDTTSNITNKSNVNPFITVTKKFPTSKSPSPIKTPPIHTDNRFDALIQPAPPTKTPPIQTDNRSDAPTQSIHPTSSDSATTSNKLNHLIETMDFDYDGLQQLGCSSPDLPSLEELMDTNE
ncbi:hypothetical protein CONCODRAFT_14100 [Conidiobolus coronatus NRRL 28638]|uniref:Uncharacterized protein n=1 Tax=Conidiobolus coronatus (strain ATCC 28846 / CBS 209.66 / NRRL 28638) TaxID=796925 RepID=A0A137NPP8_CONC2|nr:hypothetical protein CONCODRAFT_14100 [Conidiobolus coronatus NRRL 28638]|eukprot:KXN64701.1 hypothetical protein CONCODRAFT_14100 [Conidiobolus coronatus NRRL 28638]